MPRRRLVACALLLLALGVRVGYVAATSGYTLDGDAGAYDRLARAIAATGHYPDLDGRPTAYRPPALPYLLGGVDSLSPDAQRLTVDRLVLAALGTVAVGLLALLAAMLLGPRAGMATLGLAAIYPSWVTAGSSLLSEPLLIVFELAALLCAVQARRARDADWDADWGGRALPWALATGLLAGAACLARTNAVVLLPALLVGVSPSRASSAGRTSAARRFAPGALALLAAVVAVAPWTVRNAVVLHRFIPVSDEAGGTLVGSYNAASAADRDNPAGWRTLAGIPLDAGLSRAAAAPSEPALQADLLAEALRYVGRHPFYPLTVAGHNALRLLDLHGLAQTQRTARASGLRSNGWAVIDAAGFWVLALLAGAGLALGAGRRLPGFLWAAGALLMLTELLVSVETPRFRLPLEPWALLLAGAALAAGGAALGRRRSAGAEVSGIG